MKVTARIDGIGQGKLQPRVATLVARIAANVAERAGAQQAAAAASRPAAPQPKQGG